MSVINFQFSILLKVLVRHFSNFSTFSKIICERTLYKYRVGEMSSPWQLFTSKEIASKIWCTQLFFRMKRSVRSEGWIMKIVTLFWYSFLIAPTLTPHLLKIFLNTIFGESHLRIQLVRLKLTSRSVFPRF